MIDSGMETLISLAEAARLLPRQRAGKKPHTSCLYRWTKNGCKGVILESLQCGGTRVTSKEALARGRLGRRFGAGRAGRSVEERGPICLSGLNHTPRPRPTGSKLVSVRRFNHSDVKIGSPAPCRVATSEIPELAH